MSGWIKWEKDLETDPRFIRLVRSVRNACVTGALQDVLPANAIVSLTMGCLMKFWSYADTHIRADDTLDLGVEDIDELVGLPGFAQAMPDDWLVSLGESQVELPGYQEHNGVEAKKRDLAQKRMANKRARDRHGSGEQKRNASERMRNASVTTASLDQTRPDQTKTRPERAERARASPPGNGVIDCGTNLTRSAEDIAAMRAATADAWRGERGLSEPAMEAWLEHCAKLEPPKLVKPHESLALAKLLVSFGDADAQMRVVRECAANGWRNLRDTTAGRRRSAEPERKRWEPPPDPPGDAT